jgi:hypothetical protein
VVSVRQNGLLSVWHRFISVRDGVEYVRYETDHSVMYQGPFKIGTNDITCSNRQKVCEIILENKLVVSNLNVQYTYMVREGPFL